MADIAFGGFEGCKACQDVLEAVELDDNALVLGGGSTGIFQSFGNFRTQLCNHELELNTTGEGQAQTTQRNVDTDQ